jgi:hypothetical protein
MSRRLPTTRGAHDDPAISTILIEIDERLVRPGV